MAKKIKVLTKKHLLLALAIIGLALGCFLILRQSPTNEEQIPSSNPLAGSLGSGSSSASPNATGSNQNTDTQGAPSTGSGPPPATPYGNFVSNHRPGGGTLTSEVSSCNTSAGATCYIQFTNGSTVKKLDTQTTDGKGATIWYWDVESAGLSSGSWTITAVATLNGQTKTANDSLPLVVQ